MCSANFLPGLYRPSSQENELARASAPALRHLVENRVSNPETVQGTLSAIPDEARRAAFIDLYRDPQRSMPLNFYLREALTEALPSRQIAILATEMISNKDAPVALKLEAVELVSRNEYLVRAESELVRILRDPASDPELRTAAAGCLVKLGREEHLDGIVAAARAAPLPGQKSDLFSVITMTYGERGIRATFETVIDPAQSPQSREQAFVQLQWYTPSPDMHAALLESSKSLAETDHGKRAIIEYASKNPAERMEFFEVVRQAPPVSSEIEALIQNGIEKKTSGGTPALPEDPLALLAGYEAGEIESMWVGHRLARNWTPAVEVAIASSPRFLRQFESEFLEHASVAQLGCIREMAKEDPSTNAGSSVTAALIRLGDTLGFERLNETSSEKIPEYSLYRITNALIRSPHPSAAEEIFKRLDSDEKTVRDVTARSCSTEWAKGAGEQDALISKFRPVSPEYADALRSARDQHGIEVVFRIPPSSLIASEQVRSGGPLPDTDVGVFVFARRDDLSAIHASGGALREYQRRGIYPLVFEIASVTDLIKADTEIRRILNGKKAVLCRVCAHGAGDAMAFGDGDPADHGERASDGILGFKDRERLKENKVFDWMDPVRGKMPLESCSVAKEWNTEKPDMSKLMLELVPAGVTVIANSSPITEKGTEPIFGKNDDLIDIRFGSQVGGRRVRIRL